MKRELIISPTDHAQVSNSTLRLLFDRSARIKFPEEDIEWYRRLMANDTANICIALNSAFLQPDTEVKVWVLGDAFSAKIVNITPSIKDKETISRIKANYYDIQQEVFEAINPEARIDSGLLVRIENHQEWIDTELPEYIKRFSRTANKQTLYEHPSDFHRWSDIIAYAHRKQIDVPSKELSELLESLDWDLPSVEKLTEQFEYSLDLLRETQNNL